MKSINKILFVFLLSILALGCDKEDNTTPSWSDVSWYTEAGGWSNVNLVRNTGEAISFMDLSQGDYSHEWILDSGNYFITSDYSKGQDVDLRDYIIPDLDSVSKEYNINVLFTEDGLQGVRLHNSYYHPVTYIGKGNRVDENGDEIPDTLESHLGDDGMWVIDTTFYVDVYAPLAPEMQIEYGDNVLARVNQDSIYLNGNEEGIPYDVDDNTTWPTISVPIGEAFIYRDLTTIGRPESRLWTFPANSEVVDFYIDDSGNEAEIASAVKLKMLSAKSTAAGAVEPLRLKPELIAASENLKIPLFLMPEVQELKAAFEVYYRDELILTVGSDDQPSEDETSWDEIILEKGDQLKLVDITSKGVVDYTKMERSWELSDGSVSTDSVAYIAYEDLTAVDEYFKVGYFNTKRLKDNSNNIPEDTDRKVIPLRVRVELESRPTFKEGEIVASRESTADVGVYDKFISFSVSENLQDIVDQDIAKQSFVVKISNQESGLSETVFDVASVSISETDKQKVELRLTEELYNSDNITVEFTGEANNAILSEAGVSLENFSQEAVIMYGKTNVLDTDLAGFEIQKADDVTEAKGWFYQGTELFSRTNERAASGEYSMKFDAENIDVIGKTRDRVTSQSSEINLGDTFLANDPIRVRLKIYIPTGSPFTDGLVFRFQSPTANATQISTAAIVRDVWEEVSFDIIPTADLTDSQQITLMIQRGDMGGVSDTDPILFFLDDLSMELYEVRP